jgi:hypothetical protein
LNFADKCVWFSGSSIARPGPVSLLAWSRARVGRQCFFPQAPPSGFNFLFEFR